MGKMMRTSGLLGLFSGKLIFIYIIIYMCVCVSCDTKCMEIGRDNHASVCDMICLQRGVQNQTA